MAGDLLRQAAQANVWSEGDHCGQQGPPVWWVEYKLYLIFTSLTLARVTGGRDDYGDESDEILELTDGASWVKIGQMKNTRSSFGLSIVDVQTFKNTCQ